MQPCVNVDMLSGLFSFKQEDFRPTEINFLL